MGFNAVAGTRTLTLTGTNAGSNILAAVVGDNYVGLDLHRAARIMSAGHGGQVLLSDTALALVAAALPAGVSVRDMGERRLKDLSRPEHLYQLVIDGLPAEFPPLRTLDVTPNNLPTQLTSFVGRGREVAEARTLLDRSRLLTLTGPGGTGKTRLSLQVAADVADQFAGGVFFVPLDAVTDAGLVASAIVVAIGLQDAGQRTPHDRLLDFVRDRSVLLVLDNFEQVVSAAPLVTDILRASPTSKVVVSSRAVLHVSGEQEYSVPPLALPEPGPGNVTAESLAGSEGVALFVERALAARPDFRLTDDNARAILDICRRLDGLPLAIELAAARIKLLPPDAILARLGQRLNLLSSASRDLPERQQTLRGAIAWSYDLLEGGPQRLLARVSVFAGGMALEEAEAVCGSAGAPGEDVLDGLAGLVDQSLLRQAADAGEPRFRMLQTIRDFARERLDASGEADEIRRRHAAAFLALARAAEPHLTGPRQRPWLDRLEREIDNLRLALAWACETGDATTGLELGGALWRFWQMRGNLQEGYERMLAILAIPGATADPIARRRGLDAAAGLAYWRGDMDAAKPLYEESLILARASGNRAALAEALYNQSFTYMVTLDDVPRARMMANEALKLFREIGDPVGIAKAFWEVGNAEYFLGNHESAREELTKAVATWRGVGDKFGLGWALHTLGLSQIHLGDVAAARRSWVEMLEIFAEAGDMSGIGTALSNFRSLAVERGDAERAVRLAGASNALVLRTGVDLATVITEIEGRAGRERSLIDEPAAARAWATGAAMPLADAIRYALDAERAIMAG